MRSADNTFSVDKPEDSSGFLLWQVTNLWQREIRKTLQPFALTHSQFVILASAHWLNMLKQDVTQVVLSEHTKIDPMTTSSVVRTLQKNGFIDRKEHEVDTRAKTVKLTDKGKQTIKKAVVAVEKFDADFFSRLGGKTKIFNDQLQALLMK